MIERDAVHRVDHIGGDEERIAAQFHRRGAGMRFHAVHGHVVPALAERALHNADGLVVRLQHRPLLDVRFEIRCNGMRFYVFADVADGGQRVAHRDAVAVALIERMVQRKRAGEDTGAHHHRHEA